MKVGRSIVPKIRGLVPDDPYEPPEDQETILNMLVEPGTYGQGLFDYSCHGNNWHLSDKVVSIEAALLYQRYLFFSVAILINC